MDDDTLARVLSDRATVAERRAVLAWRRMSGDNERKYQALAHLLELTSSADHRRRPGPQPSAREIIARSDRAKRAGETRPLESISGERSFGRSRGRWLSGAVAAAAGVVIALGVSQFLDTSEPVPSFGAKEFATGPSEKATVVLTDGTVVRLAGDSRLRVPQGASDRDVSLTGRAFFAVARDESRPFTVRTSTGNLRVLGTRFAVDALGEDLRLVVVEGRVALSESGEEDETEVAANQMARIVKGRHLPVVRVADANALADWVGNFLAFQDTPLRDAALEIEREYGVTIEILDSGLADRTITAWFAGWELDEVMEVVCIVARAQCEVGDSLVTMKPRASDPS